MAIKPIYSLSTAYVHAHVYVLYTKGIYPMKQSLPLISGIRLFDDFSSEFQCHE